MITQSTTVKIHLRTSVHSNQLGGTQYTAHLHHAALNTHHKCATCLKLENETENDSLTGNFATPRIIMYCWSTGTLCDINNMQNVLDHFQNFINSSLVHNLSTPQVPQKFTHNVSSYSVPRQQEQVSASTNRPTWCSASRQPCCTQMLTVSVINWWLTTLTVHLSWQHLRYGWYPLKFKWSRDVTTPLSGMVCHPWARTWGGLR